MSRPVLLTQRAESDLVRLGRWIAQNGAPITALRYVRRIRSFLDTLGDFSGQGTAFDASYPGLRVVGFERRVQIAFVVRAERIDVMRVFYGGQDWQGVLMRSSRRSTSP